MHLLSLPLNKPDIHVEFFGGTDEDAQRLHTATTEAASGGRLVLGDEALPVTPFSFLHLAG
jgi:hypothetical protein